MIKSIQTSLKSTENWYKSTAFLLLSKTEQQLFFYTRAKLKALIDLWRNKIFKKKRFVSLFANNLIYQTIVRKINRIITKNETAANGSRICSETNQFLLF